MPNLYAYLQQLHESDLYPFHMPGHKRRTDLFEEEMPTLSGMYGTDFTETPFTDDLHHPTGMIADLQDRANRLYGEDRADLETRLLVNGATCGILAAVSALTNEGDTVIVARNAHRSLYHALYLRRLRVVYISPQVSDKYPFAGPVSPDDLANAITLAPEAKAVFITSPTYEGVLSDVALLSVVAHAHDIPLVVDAAHGAHLGLYQGMPRGAVRQGADVVIHSLHKTLAGMTQTALLHMQGVLVDRSRIGRFLKIYQTTSPSFPLMISVDAAISDLARNNVFRFETLLSYKETVLSESIALRTMSVAPKEAVPDPSKVVIIPQLINGLQLAYMLRTEHRIEPEMAVSTHVVCIITPYDTAEGIERLMNALYEIDREIYEAAYGPEEAEEAGEEEPAEPVVPATAGFQPIVAPGTYSAMQESGWEEAPEAEWEGDPEWEEDPEPDIVIVGNEETADATVFPEAVIAPDDAEDAEETETLEETEEAEEAEDAEPVWESPAYSLHTQFTGGLFPEIPAAYMSIADAWDKQSDEISLAEAAGLISADFIYAYPPGIPLIVPGEAFTEELCAYLLSRCAAEELHGVTPEGMVRCVLA